MAAAIELLVWRAIIVCFGMVTCMIAWRLGLFGMSYRDLRLRVGPDQLEQRLASNIQRCIGRHRALRTRPSPWLYQTGSLGDGLALMAIVEPAYDRLVS
jgi:hypothetical protein